MSTVSCEFDEGVHTPEVYKASAMVTQLHGFYHVGDADFDATSQGYQQSVAGFFAFTVALGLICMIIAWTVNICACFSCFRDWMCRCCFKNHYGSETAKNHGHYGRMLLVGLFFLAALCMTFSYISYAKLSSAMDGLAEVVTELGNSFDTMEVAAINLYRQKGNENAELTTLKESNTKPDGYAPSLILSDCQPIALISFDAFYTGSELLKDVLEGLAADLFSFASKLTGTYNDILRYFLGCLTALYWFLALLGAVATYTNHIRCDDRLFVFLTSISMLVFIPFLATCIMTSVLLADFCYGPNGDGPGASLVTTAEENLDGDTPDLVKYYVECQGTNMIVNALGDVCTVIQTVQTVTSNQNLGMVCDQNGLDGLNAESADSVSHINTVRSELKCSQITPLLDEAMNEHLCVDTVDGITSLWILLCISSLFLWLALLFFPCVTHHIKQLKEVKIGIMEAASAETLDETAEVSNSNVGAIAAEQSEVDPGGENSPPSSSSPPTTTDIPEASAVGADGADLSLSGSLATVVVSSGEATSTRINEPSESTKAVSEVASASNPAGEVELNKTQSSVASTSLSEESAAVATASNSEAKGEDDDAQSASSVPNSEDEMELP